MLGTAHQGAFFFPVFSNLLSICLIPKMVKEADSKTENQNYHCGEKKVDVGTGKMTTLTTDFWWLRPKRRPVRG